MPLVSAGDLVILLYIVYQKQRARSARRWLHRGPITGGTEFPPEKLVTCEQGDARMRFRTAVMAAAAAVVVGFAYQAEAKTFRWAFQGDAQSLDPHSLNETFTIQRFIGIIVTLANVVRPSDE